MIAEISETMWMWVLGGACSLVFGLVAFIGVRMLDGLKEVRDELGDLRIAFAESKKDMVTEAKLSSARRGMERDREVEIKLAISKHIENYSHERAV